jgi:hypothetical protein
MSNDLEFLQKILTAIEFKYPRALKHHTDLEISYDDYEKLYSVNICTHYINDEVDRVRFTSDNADLKTSLKECAAFLLKKEKKCDKDPLDYLEESLFYFDPKPESGALDDEGEGYSELDEKKYNKDPYGCKYRHMDLAKFEEYENIGNIFFCNDCNGYFKLREIPTMGAPIYGWDREGKA